MSTTTASATQQQAATTNLPDLNTSTDSASSSASATNSRSASASGSSAFASASASATDSNLPGLNDSTSSSRSSSNSRTTTSPISGGLTGAPTLPNDLPTLTGFYSYPPPTVPPRANAPYLHTSSLPSDFVFIIVGAVLGLVTILILGWRLTVAWQANRSVKLHNTKAGANYHGLGLVDTKYGGGIHADPVHVQSSHNLPDYPVRPSTGPGMQSNSSLFFSPTAAAATGVRNSQRASAYLASGYYGAGGAPH